MGKKGEGATKVKGKGKKAAQKEIPPKEEEEEESPNIDDIEKSIVELREKGKEDPESVDYVTELRKIQDKISDLKGEQRRPTTAKPLHSEDEEENEEEEEEEEEDPDKEAKDLINKRLTTCMLLALSYEDNDEYPTEFYDKLGESKKFKEVTSPITKDELKQINQLLKERKAAAKKRVDECLKK